MCIYHLNKSYLGNVISVLYFIFFTKLHDILLGNITVLVRICSIEDETTTNAMAYATNNAIAPKKGIQFFRISARQAHCKSRKNHCIHTLMLYPNGTQTARIDSVKVGL